MGKLHRLVAMAALFVASVLSSAGCGDDPLAQIIVTLRVAPSSVDFGSIPVGAAVHRPITVADDGNGPYATDSPPTLTGDGFLEASPCALPVAPKSFCTEDVVFRPQTEGRLTGTWIVHGPDGDITVPLTGHADPAQILVDPASLDFGEIAAGRSLDRTITVTNAGAGAVDVPLAVTGDGFATDAGATLHLEAGAATPVTLTFAPGHGGAFSGLAVLAICGDGCGPEVTLTGVGTAPRIDIEPRVADFGEVGVGESGSVDLVASNGGVGNLVITAADLLSGDDDVTLAAVDELPIVIAPGATSTLTLRYAPSHAQGSLDATLRVRSNDPVSPDVLVPIDGSSEGPSLQLLPAVGQFGVLDVGDSRTLDVVLRSRGTVAADVTSVAVQGAAFGFDVTGPPVGPLAPTQSLVFTVRATARAADAAAGGATGSVVVTAAGLPDLVLPLAFLSGTAGCQPRAPLPNAALGSIRIGQGSTGSVTVHNVGDATCTLGSAGPAPGFAFDAGYSFSATAARTIAPGGTAEVSFAYHAGDVGQRSAFVELLYAGAAAPLFVSSTARGVTGTLVGEPPLIEMGPVIEGCPADQRFATFVNAGSDTVVVNDIVLDPATAPFALSLPPLPTSVLPGSSISVGVSSDDVPPGVYEAAVNAVTDAVEATVRLKLTVDVQGADLTESFTAADVSQVDVLFVVDNSGSMEDDQELLATNFDTFIESAFASDNNVNFHLGITTTDVINGTGGPLVAPFLTRNTGDLVNTFARQARVGVDGAGIELGLEAMRRALGDFASSANAGFQRPAAALSVVIVSDEEDNGGDETVAAIDASVVRPVETYVEFLGGLKGGSLNNTPVLVSVVVDPQFSQRYQTVANAFNGVVLDIQDPNWGASLSQIGQATFGLQRKFRLGTDPDPTTVTVTVDGVPVTGFTVTGRDVLLDDDPAAGADVEITYRPGCAG